MRAAIHARSIVHHYASHHCRLLRCGVGTEYLAVRSQYLIHALSHDAGLQLDALCIGRHFIVFPILSRHDEYRVGDGLPRQTRSGGSEGYRQVHIARIFEQTRHFVFVFRAYHYLRQAAVESCICSPRQAVQIVGIEPLGGYVSRYPIIVLFVLCIHLCKKLLL